MPHREADIVINGVTLTHAQSMSVRVAVTGMLIELADPEHMDNLGQIGPLYRARLVEVQDLIIDATQWAPRPSVPPVLPGRTQIGTCIDRLTEVFIRKHCAPEAAEAMIAELRRLDVDDDAGRGT